MLGRTIKGKYGKEQADIKKELFQNESVRNTEEKLDANLLNRLISKIVISEPQEKDGTENYRSIPEKVTIEIHFNLKPIWESGTIESGSGSHK